MLNDNKYLHFILKKAILLHFFLNLILVILYTITVVRFYGFLKNFNFSLFSLIISFVVLIFFLKHIYFKITKFSVQKLNSYILNLKEFKEHAKSIKKHKYIFKIALYILKGLSLASFSNKNTLIAELKPSKNRIIITTLLKFDYLLGITLALISLIAILNNPYVNFFCLINNIIFIIGLYYIMLLDFKKIIKLI